MLNAPNLRLFYIIFCALIITILTVLNAKMRVSKNQYKISIANICGIGIVSIIFYAVFLCTKTIRQAVLWDGLFFAGTDWLAYAMLIFAIKYTGLTQKYLKAYRITGITYCILDSISLILNVRFHHMFNLLQTTGLAGELTIGYVANCFYWPHYIHLGMDYVMVGETFFLFGFSLIKSAGFYKKKYRGIFYSYAVVILANFVSYSFSFPIDFSVVLYGLLAIFIVYFSTYSYPKSVITHALENVQRSISDALVYYDIDGNCLYANEAAKKLFSNEDGFDPKIAEYYQQAWASLISEGSGENKVTGQDTFVIDGIEHKYELEYKKLLTEELSGLKNNGGILKLVDNTEQITHFNNEQYQATHDSLTKIYNRVGFFEAVDRYVAANEVYNRVMVFSNIMDFKLINDLFGEKTGDQILIKQARLMTQFSSKDTIFGRIGDDKFALFTRRELFTENRFTKFINEVQKITENSFYHIHVYVGVYYPEIKESAEKMYTKAMLATTTIAGNYRKTYAYYDSVLMEQLREENEIIEKFESALAENQFVMYLQPLFDKNQNIIGAETLSRWIDPSRGMRLPAEYIPVLEKCGMITLLDKFIWEQAIKTLSDWKSQGITDKFLSINVSLKDFFNINIYEYLSTLVKLYDVNPENLVIEVAENIMTSDFARAVECFKNLRKDGFCIIVDDFEKQESSLNILKDVIIDGIKLESRFLTQGYDETRNRIILDSILEMAESLDMLVVAEGVETEYQLEVLKDTNCKYFQGNLISVPVSLSEFQEKYLK